MSVPNTLAGKALLVTGAGRGLGRALVDEALHRGADRVYAAARRPADHPDPLFPDPMSASLETGWDDGVVKSLERANAAAVQAVAVAS
ncbi:hypothetical protein [Nocardia violaceofusca]|uniref:hypothetical protein n=1 Tax=Nocardia violaceofusca TaxID=941182 RepID=UPI0018DB015E